MAARGMVLPDCVTLLGCSRYLFVDGVGDILGRKWSMTNVYAARFDGARIPEQHTARGDVRCGVRLLRACVACMRRVHASRACVACLYLDAQLTHACGVVFVCAGPCAPSLMTSWRAACRRARRGCT
jgi:hypothetical protein